MRRVLIALALAIFSLWPAPASAGDYIAADVHFWIRAYAVWYANEAHPYPELVADVERVAECESVHFNVAVINNRWRGSRGEIGVGQWLPGPRSIWWLTPQAAAGYSILDPEANTAGLVWAISQGMGPVHWSCW